MQTREALVETPFIGRTQKHIMRALLRAYFNRKRKMRLNTKGMDARRGAQRMVVPFASFATPQTPFCVQTLRADHAVRAWRCYSPLAWNAKQRGSRLALRAQHGQRTFVYCCNRLLGQDDFRLVRTAIDHQLLADMLNGGRTELFTDFL